MSWYAIDAVDDAIDASRGFLFPFDLRRWVRLAVIVLFLGGSGGGGGPGFANGASNAGTNGMQFPVDAVPSRVLTALVALVIVAVLVGLVLAVVAATMRFVFVDALRTGVVRVRGPFRRWFRRGLGLFVLELLVGLLVVALVGAGVGLAVLRVVEPVVAVLLFAPVVLVVVVAVALFLLFTVEFVVPVAIAEDLGVFAGWRRFWPTLRGQPGQFGVFVLLRLVLGIALGFVVGAVLAVLAIPLLLVPVVVGGLVLFGAGTIGLLEAAVVALVALPFLVLLLLVGLALQIPVSTYFGYYALLVLGDANAAFDLIPDRRAAIRAGEA